MKITSEEIARLANVSRSTVSRVINNYPNVPEPTRQKVMGVIEKYGYKPNAFARVLAGKSNMEIALCISNDNSGDGNRWKGMESPYFMRLIAELITQSKAYGYMISVLVISTEADYEEIENRLLNREICGGVFVGFEFQMERINAIAEKGFNMVVIDPDDSLKQADNVKAIYSENERGAFLAVEYLLKKKYARIGHIRGDNRLSARERLEGYCKAMEAAGYRREELPVEYGGFNREYAYRAAVRLMQEHQVDAIFAADDITAIAATRAAADLNKRVPEDVGIMGCDYVSLYDDLGIHLTTVEISVREIAKIAVRAVLDIEKEKQIVCRPAIRAGHTA